MIDPPFCLSVSLPRPMLRASPTGSTLDQSTRNRIDDRCSTDIGARRATESALRPEAPATRIQPPLRSRARPEADSWLGQNCGGNRLARVANHNGEEHVCLFCNLTNIKTSNVAVFGTDVLPGDGISHSDVSKRIKQIFLRHTCIVAEKFSCSAGIQHFPPSPRVNTR